MTAAYIAQFMAKIHGETTAQHLASCEAALEQRNQTLDAATARAEKAEAEANAAALEVTHFRQLNQQNEEGLTKLARRVLEQQAELAEQEVDKLALLREVQTLRNANFRLEKERALHKNNGRFPLCLICENGPALCECSPTPKKRK